MSDKPKLIWADNLRAIATIAVIMLHVSADLLSRIGKVNDSYWLIGCIYNGLTRFAVPVFVMLSGALLLNRDYTLADFLKKRFSRILLPFLFWSLVYIAVGLYFKHLHGYDFEFTQTAAWITRQLLNGSSYHFWFIYMILALYLLIPFLSKWIRHCTRKEICYFLLIWFCIQILDLTFFQDYQPKIRFEYFTGYSGYLVLGYLLSRESFARIENKKTVCLNIFILSAVFSVGMTSWQSIQTHKNAGEWFHPLAPGSVLMASGLFLFFRNLNFSNSFLNKILGFVSRYSFGIYLVHVLILSRMANWFGIHWNFTHPAISIPLTTLLCLITSAITVFLVNKLPAGRYISG